MNTQKQHRGHRMTTLLLFFLLAVAVVFAVLPLQRRIASRLDEFKVEVVGRLEQILGRSISYDSIAPSIFQFIEIRGLVIHSDTQDSPPLLSIAKIRVFYRLGDLLRGETRNILREIRIENSAFSFDLDSDRDLFNSFSSLGENPASFPDITFSGKNLSFRLTSETQDLEVEKLFFELKPSGDRLRFQGRFSVGTDSVPVIPGLRDLNAHVRVSGSLLKDYSASSMQIRCTNITSSLVELPRITLHAEHRGSRITLQKIQDKAPFDIFLSFDGEPQILEVSFASEGFIPSTYLTLRGDLEQYAPWLTTILSGEAEVLYSLKNNDLNYTAALKARLDNKILPAVFATEIDIFGDLSTLVCRSLRVDSVYGQWGFRGSITPGSPFPIPEGTLAIRNLPLGETLVHSVVTIERKDPFVTVQSSDLRIGGISLEKTIIELFPYNESIDFLLSTYLKADDQKPMFAGEGSLQLLPDLFLQASAGVDGLPLGPLAAMFSDNRRITDTADTLSLSTYIFLSTDFDRFSFTTPGVELLDAEVPDNRISFSLSGNNSGFQVNDLDADWNESRLTGKASIGLREEGFVSTNLSLTFQDTPYTLSGEWHQGGELTITGNYGIRAGIQTGKNSLPFYFSCEGFPVPFQDNLARLSVRSEGFFESTEQWELNIHEALITGLPLPDNENSLSLAGRIDGNRAVLHRVAFSDRFSVLTGSASADISLLRSAGSGWIELMDSADAEHYTLRFDNRDTLDVSAQIVHAPIGRFTSGGLTGLAGGLLEITGSRENPDISFTGSVESGEFNGDPFSASIEASYREREFICDTLDLRFMNNRLQNTRFRYNLGAGTFEAEGRLRGTMKEDVFNADISFSGRTLPGDMLRDIPGILKEQVTADLSITNIRKGETLIDPFNLAFRSSDGFIHAEGGPENSLRAHMAPDRSFTLDMYQPLPLRAHAEGRLEKSVIYADITDVDLDVQVLDIVMRIPEFRFLEGKAEGYLSISGSFNDPEINGILNASSVVAENPYINDKIGPFDTVLVFEEKTLSLLNTFLPAGKARAVADVTFNLDHWVSESFEIDIQTISQEGLHVVSSFSRMNVDGYILGHLNLLGDPNILYLTGDLEALSTIVTLQNVEEVKEDTGPVQRYLVADVSIKTGRGVEFLWPSRNLPVLRTFAETGERIRVRYDKTKEQFTIQGEVGIKGGQIYYVQRNFYLREGSIAFNENQNKFDPILSATAEIREIDRDGKAVKIYLIVEENAFSTFQPRFESDPAMSTVDIFSIIGVQSFYASDDQSFDLSQAVALTGDFLGQFGLLRSFEERVKNIFHLDLFTLRTPVVSNILLDKILPSEISDNYNEPESLGKYLDNTTLFLGKYFGNDVFLQAMMRLDFYNQFSGGPYTSSEMYLDTEITLEWKTPVTLIEFSLLRDITEGSNSFFNPSLGLSWRYSY